MGPPNQPLHPDAPIPPTRLARDPSRRHDAYQQSRLFARWHQWLIEIAQVHGFFSSLSF
jgi:hypothetical protein